MQEASTEAPCGQREHDLGRLAHPQRVLRFAVFTRQEALDKGWTPRKIRTQLANGVWTQLTIGRYVDSDYYTNASPQDRHALKAMAVAYQRQLVVHRESAACLHGLRVLDVPPDVATLPRHRVADEDLTTAYRVNVTSITRTVLDVSRFTGIEAGLVVADSALAQRAVERPELCEQAVRLGRCHGRTAAMTVAGEADGRAESAFESISRYRLVRLAVPRPELQVRLLGYRVDFLWRAQRVIGEADGLRKYGCTEAEVRANVRAERLRQRKLEDAGYTFVRWLWEEIWFRPEVVAARVMQKITG